MNIQGITRNKLEDYLASQNVAPVHAKEMFRNLYQRHAPEPWMSKGLPKRLAKLFKTDERPLLRIKKTAISRYDNSAKFLYQLADELLVEAVLMPESTRLTICISSQVGCAQGCVFCHTGRMGLSRNLTAAEIVGQIHRAHEWIRAHPEWLVQAQLPKDTTVTNVVFMGMGEPLDNAQAVIDAVRIMTDPCGLNLAPSKVSVSTAGHLPGLQELLAALPKIHLAISIHNGDSEKRSKILPINRKWPIASVMQTIRQHQAKGGNVIFVQYTLINGVNDSPEDAASLRRLLEGIDAKINLIPLNPIDKMRLKSSDSDHIQAFRDLLHQAGLRTLIRYSKGQDIAAACGQLVDSEKKHHLKNRQILADSPIYPQG